MVLANPTCIHSSGQPYIFVAARPPGKERGESGRPKGWTCY